VGDRVESQDLLLGGHADGHHASPRIEVQLEERTAVALDPQRLLDQNEIPGRTETDGQLPAEAFDPENRLTDPRIALPLGIEFVAVEAAEAGDLRSGCAAVAVAVVHLEARAVERGADAAAPA
jgi:hypothetical protein